MFLLLFLAVYFSCSFFLSFKILAKTGKKTQKKRHNSRNLKKYALAARLGTTNRCFVVVVVFRSWLCIFLVLSSSLSKNTWQKQERKHKGNANILPQFCRQLSRDGNLHDMGMSHATTAPKLFFRAPWRVGDTMVGRENPGWTTSKSGHPCSELLTMASRRKDWKRIPADVSLMFPRRPNRSRD